MYNQHLCIKNAIIDGSALAVSDGSYYPTEEVAACAWTVSTPDGKEHVEGGGMLPGIKNNKTVKGRN